MSNSLFEAFQTLETLDEDMFNVTTDGIAKLKEFENGDSIEEYETIIDPLAETDEDLKDSYLGKAILNCIICQSKIYKDPSEITLSEDESLVNVGEECPYCQSPDGYKVIGQVAEFKPEDSENDSSEIDTTLESEPKSTEIDLEVEEKDELDEAIRTKRGVKKIQSVKEDLNKVDIETDESKLTVTSDENGQVSVTTTPKVNEIAEPMSVEPEFVDYDFDEFDEEEFDDLGESYLKRVYENVDSYKTTKGSVKGNTLKLEGIINFKSGKKAKTEFIFESSMATKTGKVKFTGMNEQFAKGKKSFTLTGKVNGKKLIAESLTYNYRAKDAKSGNSTKLYGTVKSCKK